MEYDQSKIETKLTEEIMLIFSELGKDKVNEIIKLDTRAYNMVYSYVHKVVINHIKELEGTIEKMKEKTTLNEVKRFECGTDEEVVFKHLIENKVKIMKWTHEICTVVNIVESESYPIIISNGERYSKSWFFKNFTNIDGSKFYYDKKRKLLPQLRA